MKRIPIAGPWITRKEIDSVTDAVTNAWYEDANIYHSRFEQAFAKYTDRKYAIALPSCTAAIHLALVALNIQPGDEVIVPDITWIATAAPIQYVGATPVFADIDPQSWCLSAASFEACITSRTKAVIVVDLYGNMPDMEAIQAVADRHGIAVIEDAAEAVGAEYRNRKAGSFGEVSTFSFHGSKVLTTGEGGMLLTNRQNIYERCLSLRDHGRGAGDKVFWNQEVAFKYKMSSMQAALGLAQLKRIDELIGFKRRLFGWYQKRLNSLSTVQLNHEASGIKNIYWMVTALIQTENRMEKEACMEKLAAEGIETRPFFYPLSSLPAYQSLPGIEQAKEKNRVAYEISPFGINLPSAFCVTESDVERIYIAMRRICGT